MANEPTKTNGSDPELSRDESIIPTSSDDDRDTSSTRRGDSARLDADPALAKLLMMRSTYSGPMLPPKELARLDELVPGEARRQCDDLHSEKEHRRMMDLREITRNERNDRRQFASHVAGQLLAFFTCVLLLAVAAYCVYAGQAQWAAAICGCLAAVVGAFAWQYVAHRKSETPDED